MHKEIEKKIGIIILILYVAGFVTWNTYLSNFGFFEFDLLQTRFVSAGFLCLVIPVIILVTSSKSRDKFSRLNIVTQSLCFFIWAIFFGTVVFSYVPQYLGGAKPFLASVVMEPDMVRAFKLMGYSYPVSDTDSIETIRGCKIYENKEQVLMGFGVIDNEKTSTTTIAATNARLLYISKNKIQALSVLPQNQLTDLYNLSEYELLCSPLLMLYDVRPGLIKN